MGTPPGGSLTRMDTVLLHCPIRATAANSSCNYPHYTVYTSGELKNTSFLCKSSRPVKGKGSDRGPLVLPVAPSLPSHENVGSRSPWIS